MRYKNHLGKVFIGLVVASIGVIFSFTPQDNKEGRPVWTAPAWTDTLKNPFGESRKVSEDAKGIFATTCALCHGETGEGNGLAAESLTPRPANFTSERVLNETDGALFWKMSTGNPPMASYKDAFTEEQRWQLVNYIRLLQKNKADADSERVEQNK